VLRYILAATGLKMFSYTPNTKRLYRAIGNTIGARNRSRGLMPKYYFDRVNRMLELNRRHNVFQEGYRFLELGTGWLHWEAITCRLFFDVHCTLYDVWDNRQMSGLKNYLSQLDTKLIKLNAEETQLDRAHRLIAEIMDVSDFEELYRLLGFEYVIDQSGRLTQFDDASFNIIVSGGVLEHIPASFAPEFVGNIARVLKPGGHSFHGINLRDHLYQYDRTVSPKQYLQYSYRVWKQWFENDVQYINKIQRSDWLALFETAGLKLIEEQIDTEDISGLRVARDYQKYHESDVRCCGLRLLHSKP
jgi:SAM-dependent methyltransferase